MEKYMSTCRLILCCNSTSRVIPAVRSRCLGIRVSAPTNDQISTILKTACKQEGLTIPNDLATRIAVKSNRNLRRALLMCETTYVAHYPFTSDQEISEPDWELFLKETARLASQQQTVERVVMIRDRLYELLCHCIPADIIFKVKRNSYRKFFVKYKYIVLFLKGLLKELLSSCDEQLKPVIVDMAADLEHKMNLGDKEIFYLESFVVKFMSEYKKYLDKSLMSLMI